MSEQPATTKAADAGAYRAALGFPLLVIVGGVVGYLLPEAGQAVSPYTNLLLGVIMFAMGLTLKPKDFQLVLTRPLPVLLGVAAQYVAMPAIAVFVSWVLNLPPLIAAGVILVGCTPGGTASNTVSYLARGDVALSVTITSISTLLAPVVTPALALWLAGESLPVSFADMATTILFVVLVPVVAGIVVSVFLDRLVDRVAPALPWLAVVAIALIVMAVVSGSREEIATAGLAVFAAVVIHNALGYAVGYGLCRVVGQPVPVRRAMAVEVGMQNSGLAASLASQYLSPLSALPAAVFSVWHNLSGAVFAALCRRSDRKRVETAARAGAAD